MEEEFLGLTRSNSLSTNVSVGAEIPVGEFFWITTCIGFASNACHGHGFKRKANVGSADVDCTVRVLAIDQGIAMVVLVRPEMPYGALAPHGTIFLIPVEVFAQWSEMTAHRLRQESMIGKMQQFFLNVSV